MFMTLLYQAQPLFINPKKKYQTTWTDSIQGYCYEAIVLTKVCILNEKYLGHRYKWKIDLTISPEITIDQHKTIWTKATRVLSRLGMNALWVREINKRNKIHYHLTVCNNVAVSEIQSMIEQAMPKRSDIKWNIWIRPITNSFGWLAYSVKSKVSAVIDGRYVADKYRHKRLLFQKGLNIRKHGTIGNFWAEGWNKSKLWKEIIARERRISKATEDYGSQLLIDRLEQWLPDTDSYKIKEAVGLFHHYYTDWINQLIREEEGWFAS
jgi:uncharacterized protein (UPF0332 family)